MHIEIKMKLSLEEAKWLESFEDNVKKINFGQTIDTSEFRILKKVKEGLMKKYAVRDPLELGP